MANTKFSNDTDSLIMLENLTKGLNFNIPNVDLSGAGFNLPQSLIDRLNQTPEVLSVDSLTEPKLKGNATFDRIMHSVSMHLYEENIKGRITGADYTNAYIQLSSVALQCAVEFELGRLKQQWEGINAQIQAIKSNVELASAKVQLAIAQAQAHNAKAQYANTVAQLAVADANYALVQQQIDSFRARDRKDAVELQTSAWTVMKGTDEGINPPSYFTNAKLDANLQKIYQNLGIE